MGNRFITFEGVEGCGKSTQVELLKGYLEKKGFKVLLVREPGGTRLGEKVRAILLNSEGDGMAPLTELFLYEACRAELVEKVIAPALKRGVFVICDRFVDSTVAYQGFGRGLKTDIPLLNKLASNGLTPDVTFLLDLDPEIGLKRARKRISKTALKEDRFEKESLDFHKRVRKGFLKIAADTPKRVRVISGDGGIPLIHNAICDIINKSVLKDKR
ncbi:MAG: dTMP kinase [Deltaproteobacteria bacterium]|nr:dTMP kinase [Deltaproteobacteria bacterium]